MKIGGFQKVSLIDYPGRISAVVFTQGCNFRCPYCHNPELVNPALFGDLIHEQAILDFLETRRGKLDAVTVTGGEPTLQEDLPLFLRKVKEKGFLVKIDTNGSFPAMIGKILEKELVDYFAMDLKGTWDKYATIVQAKVRREDISESIALIINSGIPHEFRTTVVPSLLRKEDILSMSGLIASSQRYVLQEFVPSKLLDPQMAHGDKISLHDLLDLQLHLEKSLSCVMIR